MIPKKWILLAEANPNEADQTLRALAEGSAPPAVAVAHDGPAVLDCLHRRNGFRNRPEGLPAVVLLELKLAGLGGWEVLRRMKSDAQLRTVPVVIFAPARNEDDVLRSYQLGASAYLVKPSQFSQLTVMLETVRAFWIVINELPSAAAREGASEREQFATAA